MSSHVANCSQSVINRFLLFTVLLCCCCPPLSSTPSSCLTMDNSCSTLVRLMVLFGGLHRFVFGQVGQERHVKQQTTTISRDGRDDDDADNNNNQPRTSSTVMTTTTTTNNNNNMLYQPRWPQRRQQEQQSAENHFYFEWTEELRTIIKVDERDSTSQRNKKKRWMKNKNAEWKIKTLNEK